jgi:DeoR/GlpR family transcriptional regulator of sugar metabolism
MLAADRHRHILELLEREGSTSNAQLADDLEVSLMTVRRDLSDLEHRGLVQRVHGGVQRLGNADVIYSLRATRDLKAKRAIGLAAAALVRDDETIYLDAGTTTIEVARSLRRCKLRHIKVVTHAVNIATELAGQPQFTVIQVGGEIYRQTYAATGPLALEAIRRFSFDRLFLAAQGFTLEGGVSNGNLTENEIKQTAMQTARWVALVADASKYGQTMFSRIAALERIHALVTDNRLGADVIKALKRLRLEVILARP